MFRNNNIENPLLDIFKPVDAYGHGADGFTSLVNHRGGDNKNLSARVFCHDDVGINGVFALHGSVTLDPEQCREAGIYPLEFVYIWNKSNGQRISTYVIFGEPGSRCCILNGAAARSCQRGDEVIISAFEYVDAPKDICNRKPVVLTFNEDNSVQERLRYVVDGGEEEGFGFHIEAE